jgi:tetratricopeptide (TPR) repeat protein
MQSQKQTVTLAFVIMICLALIFALSRYMEINRPSVDKELEDEKLYVTGSTAKKMSMGFNGLIADWYWMRALQHVGSRSLNYQGEYNLDHLEALNITLLYPLLDNATTLDPQFVAAYEYGAVVLPAINKEDAIKLVKKGIAANPGRWQFYHHLGFIYWKSSDFKLASQTYLEGSKIPGAPQWMKAMSARLEAEGGSRETAREMFKVMFDESDEPNIRELAAKRLLQIESFDERDAIQQAIGNFYKREHRCPASWIELNADLRAAILPSKRGLRFDANGAVIDPSDAPYLLINNGCNVDLDWKVSKVPYK